MTEIGQAESGKPRLTRSKLELQQPYVAPRNEAEWLLAGIWQSIFRMDQVGIYDDFLLLGGNSLLSILIASSANRRGIRLYPRQIFKNPTIAKLAMATHPPSKISLYEDMAIAADINFDKTGDLIEDLVPLLPAQYFFFNLISRLPGHNTWDANHHNISMLIEVDPRFDVHLIIQAMHHVSCNHGALKTRFVQNKMVWYQILADPKAKILFNYFPLLNLPEVEQGQAIETICTKLEASLDLTDGSLCRIALFDLGLQRPARLFVVIHHLISDGFSMNILVEDFYSAYMQLYLGQKVSLPPEETSIQYWVQHLAKHAQTPGFRKELEAWLSKPWHEIAPLPMDFPEGNITNTFASACVVNMYLDVSETRMLFYQVIRSSGVQIMDIIITALVYAIRDWITENAFQVEIVGHGRGGGPDDIDLHRTVGILIQGKHYIIDLDRTKSLEDTLQSVKAQMCCDKGYTGDMVCYTNDTNLIKKVLALPLREMYVNYVGRYNTKSRHNIPIDPLKTSSVLERPGSRQPLESNRGVILSWTISVRDDEFCLSLEYSSEIHEQSTVKQLGQNYMQALRSIIRIYRDF
jgi:hypothetical protein